MLRARINIMLRSLLGNDVELVKKWYITPNKAFDGRCPIKVPKEELYKYLLEFYL